MSKRYCRGHCVLSKKVVIIKSHCNVPSTYNAKLPKLQQISNVHIPPQSHRQDMEEKGLPKIAAKIHTAIRPPTLMRCSHGGVNCTDLTSAPGS